MLNISGLIQYKHSTKRPNKEPFSPYAKDHIQGELQNLISVILHLQKVKKSGGCINNEKLQQIIDNMLEVKEDLEQFLKTGGRRVRKVEEPFYPMF